MSETVATEPPAITERLDLSGLVGQTFKKSRHGNHLVVTVKEVGKRDIKLAEAGRVDSFTVSIKEFLKFYQPYQPK